MTSTVGAAQTDGIPAYATVPKRIILSRKGFDFSAGKKPSPITNGLMLSIPIPEMLPPKTQYRQIPSPFPEFPDLGSLVRTITKRQYSGDFAAHLDPDLRKSALKRDLGWCPLFGQDNRSQTHLEKTCGVRKGDMFLFYGLFKDLEQTSRGSFVYRGKERHVLWGWLSIGSILPVTMSSDVPNWARYHSHAYDHCRTNNTLYIADEACLTDLPGAGCFPTYHKELRLSAEAESCSVWALPEWFDPSRGSKIPEGLSCHGPKKDGTSRWRQMKDKRWRLESAYPGQEFVFSTEDYPESLRWAEDLIRQYGRGSNLL